MEGSLFLKPSQLISAYSSGYRCMKAFKDEGPEAEKYTIKMDGCHSCPIHCYSDLRVPASAANGGYEITGNTCVPNFPFTHSCWVEGTTWLLLEPTISRSM